MPSAHNTLPHTPEQPEVPGRDPDTPPPHAPDEPKPAPIKQPPGPRGPEPEIDDPERREPQRVTAAGRAARSGAER